MIQDGELRHNGVTVNLPALPDGLDWVLQQHESGDWIISAPGSKFKPKWILEVLGLMLGGFEVWGRDLGSWGLGVALGARNPQHTLQRPLQANPTKSTQILSNPLKSTRNHLKILQTPLKTLQTLPPLPHKLFCQNCFTFGKMTFCLNLGTALRRL